MKTKPFKELLEKRLTKEEIAEIEQAAQKEVQELKEKHECKRTIDYDCGTGEYRCYKNEDNKFVLRIELTQPGYDRNETMDTEIEVKFCPFCGYTIPYKRLFKCSDCGIDAPDKNFTLKDYDNPLPLPWIIYKDKEYCEECAKKNGLLRI
jgi:hypothetical protein